jgi:polyisoprenoid-binding protein YceI
MKECFLPFEKRGAMKNMKQVLTATFLFASLMGGYSASALTFSIDNAHSQLGFKVKHLMVANVRGHFDKWNGTFNFDPKTGKASNLKIEVDTASITTSDADRDKHLRSDDFFRTGKFPKAIFEAKEFTMKKGSPTTVDGTLTLLGVPKKAKLKISYLGEPTDPWGNTKEAFEGSGTIKRSDYGMTWNKQLDKGGLLVSDDVELEIDAQATAKVDEKKGA